MTELEEQYEYLLYPPRGKKTLSCDQINLHGTQLFSQKETGGPGQEKLLLRIQIVKHITAHEQRERLFIKL